MLGQTDEEYESRRETRWLEWDDHREGCSSCHSLCGLASKIPNCQIGRKLFYQFLGGESIYSYDLTWTKIPYQNGNLADIYEKK